AAAAGGAALLADVARTGPHHLDAALEAQRCVVVDRHVADPTRRWFSRELGGGALMDVGIYPAALAVGLLGPPESVHATGVLSDTGVDEQAAVAMQHPVGALASWSCSLVADTGVEATVAGEEGSLRVRGPFHHSPGLELRNRERVVQVIDAPEHDLGLRHEVREVQRCLDAGLTESDRIPLELTLDVLGVLDEVRRQLGVTFPRVVGSSSDPPT
ncbi:MAG: Gfo/Idh/MocA family oxidoreductase, partial [Nitriliruptoraceae bacterium]